MIRQGIRTTHPLLPPQTIGDPIILEPPHRITDRKHYVGTTCIKFDDLTGLIATDLPGRFPVTSGQGNAYIIVLYDFGVNVILACPIKT